MRGLIRKLRLFRGDRGGNVALITGLAAIPLFGLLGFAIDYGVSLSNKAKLDAAADAAALTAITTARTIVNAQNGSLTSPTDAVAAGRTQGLATFKANAGTVAFASIPTPSVVITPSGNNKTLTSTVTYTTPVTNNFSRIIGIPTTAVSGTSVATLTLPRYQDFYLLLDVSGSMGLPSTSSGQNQLQAINHDNDNTDGSTGCQFACHFSGYSGYDLSRSNKIQLRADAVGNAVCQLIQTAQAQENSALTGLPNQYRIGVYPFIVNMGTLFALNKDLSAAMQKVTGNTNPCPTTAALSAFANLLDNGTGSFSGVTGNLGSGGTHFDLVLPQMQAAIPTSAIGDGTTTTNRQPFVFIVTDGMNNSQTYSGNFQGGSNPQPIGNPTPAASVCAGLAGQSNGSNKITVAVLYIPYTPLTWKQDPYGEDAASNAAIPSLPSQLTRCASPGYFFTASSPAEITAALQTMFAQATQIARISK